MALYIKPPTKGKAKKVDKTKKLVSQSTLKSPSIADLGQCFSGFNEEKESTIEIQKDSTLKGKLDLNGTG